MSIVIRAATPDDVASFRRVMNLAFGSDPTPEGLERLGLIWEPARSYCAFDDGQIVATSGAFSLHLTVPGAELPAGGTTMVSVLPTHRRQGLLRRMFEAHLRDVSDRGEPLAALWASESMIYGRFGFGVAGVGNELVISRQHTAFHRLAPSPAAVRMIEADQARLALPLIYDLARSKWPGFYARTEGWWQARTFADPTEHREGATSFRYAVTAANDGYVVYRQKEQWEEGSGAGQIVVKELIGLSPEAWSGLWGFVLNHDLISTVTANLRPEHDPLLDLLQAPRRVKQRPSDSIWVRVHDPVAALSLRRYEAEGNLVIETRDPITNGVTVVELEAGLDGATCRPSDRAPGLSMDLEDLGACYLGRARFRSLAALGRVKGDDGTLRRADLMFGWDPQPWCPEVF